MKDPFPVCFKKSCVWAELRGWDRPVQDPVGTGLQVGPRDGTCAESEEGEQDGGPGHGEVAPELCLLRLHRTSGLNRLLIPFSVL